MPLQQPGFWGIALVVVVSAVALDLLLMGLARRYWQNRRSGAASAPGPEAAASAEPRVYFLGAFSPVLTLLRYGRLPSAPTGNGEATMSVKNNRPSSQPADSTTAGAVAAHPRTHLMAAYSAVLSRLRLRSQPRVRLNAISWEHARAQLIPVLEVIGIAIFAGWVGRHYLTLDAYQWPTGGEMGAQISMHHFWVRLQQCGACALWNGSFNGGFPALGDVFGSTFHPVVMITTLLWGTVNGAKLAVVAALWLGGVAQWWLARALGLGRAARLWSALLAVVGGHLAGRMQNANFGLVLSTAACSLALAAAFDLALNGGRRRTIRLALMGAMAIVSGQGYMQLALLAWAPAFVWLLLAPDLRLRSIWREFALSVGLAAVIAGFYLVPLLHFWPQVFKETDAAWSAAQPLEYLPLNLVIRDTHFMGLEVLGKLPYPYMYNLYIGWAPLLLAPLALRWVRPGHGRALATLASGVFLIFVLATGLPLKWLLTVMPSVSGFRHVPLVAGLTVPGVLAVAAYGLDRLLALEWPRLVLNWMAKTYARPALSLAWVLILPLGGGLVDAYNLGQAYLTTTNAQPIYVLVPALKTPTLEWVSPPYGEHYWIEPGLHENLKMTNVAWAWAWRDRPNPMPRLVALREGELPNMNISGYLGDLPIYQDTTAEYAQVALADQLVPCTATGSGGSLEVHCTVNQPGRLTLQENAWSGWVAQVDGKPTPLLFGNNLSVAALAGDHLYTFRYRPWDVPLGLTISLAGLLLAGWLWLQAAASQAAGHPTPLFSDAGLDR